MSATLLGVLIGLGVSALLVLVFVVWSIWCLITGRY